MAQERVTRGVELESVVINSSRFINPAGINIYGLVTDIEIFEQMDLPYITGQIAFVDTERLLDRIMFDGGESLTITMKQSNNDNTITKTFFIDSMIATAKINETSELITLHFMEDIAFISRFLNVNRSYSGSPDSIIKKISNEYLKKDIDLINEDVFENKMKVIVPNLEPIAAMSWIKNRMTTSEGMPFYLFSSFIGTRLNLVDLKSMINAPPVNPRSPFMHGVNNLYTENEQGAFRYYPIMNYSHVDTDNLYDLVGNGLVGATYSYYDSNSGKFSKQKFDINSTLVNVNDDKNKKVNLPVDLEIRDDLDPISINSARKIYQLSQSGVYDDGTGRFKSYDEEAFQTSHMQKVKNRSLKHTLLKDNISIRISGSGFLQGEYHRTVGNVIRLGFKANRPSDQDIAFDLKKSGDYIIYSCKHSIRSEKYDLHLQCAKLTSYKDDKFLRNAG